MSTVTTTTTTPSPRLTLYGSTSSKVYQPIPIKVDPTATKRATGSSFLHNLLRDQFSLTTWLSMGATLQMMLFLTFKPSHAALPVICYTIWTIGSLLHSGLAPVSPNPHVNYHRTTALLPSTSGEHRSGTSGEKVAVLHLGFKNYSPLGLAAPGYKTILEYAPAMMAELDSAEGREKYGFLGADSFLQASSPVSTSSSTLMLIMYFRSLEGVHAYAQSDLHRKAWDWYHNFAKGQGATNKHLGIMHEVFESPAGQWETVHVNMESVGLGRTSVRPEDGSEIGTLVDATKGPLASAKGRIS